MWMLLLFMLSKQILGKYAKCLVLNFGYNKKNCISNKNETINKLLSLAMSNAYMHKHIHRHARTLMHKQFCRTAINDGQVGKNAAQLSMCMSLCTRTLSDFSLHLFTIDRTLSVAFSQVVSYRIALYAYACIVELYRCTLDGATYKATLIRLYSNSYFKCYNLFICSVYVY